MIAQHGTASHLESLVQGYRRVQRYEEETLEANTQYANRYLSYYHDDEGCLVISARLPAEQGEVLLTERKNVPAGTFPENTKDSNHEVSEPFAAQRADALVLMAENFHLHEGGFQMIHETCGALSFLTPSGNRICEYPHPVTSDKSLEVINQQARLDIHPDTAVPNWQGEVMDLDLAVSGMYALAEE